MDLKNEECGRRGTEKNTRLERNQNILPDRVANLRGTEKITELASTLGLSREEASGGLSEALPPMVDIARRGGSLLDSSGGVLGAINLAGKLFGP